MEKCTICSRIMTDLNTFKIFKDDTDSGSWVCGACYMQIQDKKINL